MRDFWEVDSAAVVSMPPIEEEKFLEAVALVVGRNLDLVPKHAAFGASGSMYIRPLMVCLLFLDFEARGNELTLGCMIVRIRS